MENTAFSSNSKLINEKTVNENETTDGLLSNNPLNATQATQQQEQQQEAVAVVEQNNLAFSCYYCSNFQTNVEGDYEHHVISVHPRKPSYPSKPDLKRLGVEAKGKEWEI